MVVNTRVSSKMMISMVKVSKHLLMDLLLIMVSGKMVSQLVNHIPEMSMVGSPREDICILVGRRDTSDLRWGYLNTIQKSPVRQNA